MRKALSLLFFAAMACGQAQPASTVPTTSAVYATSPTPASCRLPIAITDRSGNLQGAFVDYASGSVTIDPNGVGGAYYDRAFSRWLPVQQTAVSPDGSRYAVLDGKVLGTSAPQRLHVIEIATGGDKPYELVPTGNPSGYVIISFAAEGVWLTYAGYEGPRVGLFLFDLTTGQMKDVSGQHLILDAVSGGPGVFWFTDGGPNPQASAIGFIIPARVNRLTVADGKAEEWFRKDGAYIHVLGLDGADHPILTDASEVWVAASVGDVKLVPVPAGYYQVLADEHGIWFGGAPGIYLYSASGEVQKVTEYVAAPAGSCA